MSQRKTQVATRSDTTPQPDLIWDHLGRLSQVKNAAGTVTPSVGNDWSGERQLDWAGTNSNLRYYGTNAHHDVTRVLPTACHHTDVRRSHRRGLAGRAEVTTRRSTGERD